jgi:hypothetical protein
MLWAPGLLSTQMQSADRVRKRPMLKVDQTRWTGRQNRTIDPEWSRLCHVVGYRKGSFRRKIAEGSFLRHPRLFEAVEDAFALCQVGLSLNAATLKRRMAITGSIRSLRSVLSRARSGPRRCRRGDCSPRYRRGEDRDDLALHLTACHRSWSPAGSPHEAQNYGKFSEKAMPHIARRCSRLESGGGASVRLESPTGKSSEAS